MEYKIVEHLSDNIEIFDSSGLQLIRVKRKHTWTGKRISKFYQDDRLILTSDYRSFLLKEYISITFQDLGIPIVLDKINKDFYLTYSDSVLNAKFKLWRSPFCSFFNKESKIGEVNPERRGISLPPMRYKANFINDGPDNVYSLLLFSMQLGTWDV